MMQPTPSYDLDAKTMALQKRKEEERKLGQEIDSFLKRGGGDDTVEGCGICNLFGRRRKAVRTASASGASSTSASSAKGLFGVSKKVDATAKLQEAAQAMEARVEQLEVRIHSQKGEAASLMRQGKKAAALRMMKKAKAIEAQCAATQASLDAVEQQVSMLEQAQVQKTLASALKSTTKGLKKDKALLKNAEQAVEGAIEAKDLAEDLNQVMGDFSFQTEADEEEMLEELREMMGTAVTPPPPIEREEDPAVAAARALEAKHAELDAQAELKRRLPSAPSRKKEERAGLLTSI